MKTNFQSTQNSTVRDTQHIEGHQEYLLTQTLYQHLEAFQRIGLKIPSRDFVQKIETGLHEKIRECFHDRKVNVESVPFEEFSNEVVCLARHLDSTLSNSVFVSTAPIIAAHLPHSIRIEMSRIYDLEGNFLGIGPRPGNPPIEVQIEEEKKHLDDKQVVIIEDGSFTGSSLKFLISKFRAAGIGVQAIVLGVLFPKAEKTLRKEFNGELHSCRTMENPIDWMPTHDFFPFVPNAGRVIGHQIDGYALPLYLHNESVTAVPYLLPFTKKLKLAMEWTGIECGKPEIYALAWFCLESAGSIFHEIDRLNRRNTPIRIMDVTHTYPRTYTPVYLQSGLKDVPSSSEGIVGLFENNFKSDLQQYYY